MYTKMREFAEHITKVIGSMNRLRELAEPTRAAAAAQAQQSLLKFLEEMH